VVRAHDAGSDHADTQRTICAVLHRNHTVPRPLPNLAVPSTAPKRVRPMLHSPDDTN
jgi:hypothetical protein